LRAARASEIRERLLLSRRKARWLEAADEGASLEE